jgi:hypothetical protein
MKVNDTLRVEPMFDYKHGRRFKVYIVNKEPGENFTTHYDAMGKEYVKLKLTDADILQIIQELQRNMTNPMNDPKILQTQFAKNRFKVVDSKEESDGN